MSHYGKPTIPLKSENGKLLVLSFMSKDTDRLVWIERTDILQ